jgi:uncharacterized membrane protein (UPF0136 family)
MNADQRKLIVREIEGWRKSRLLPEHYCDFLLNLYLEDHATREKQVGGISFTAIQNSNWKLWMMIIGVIAVIALFVLNFSSFGLPMQIGVSGLLVALFYMVGASRRNKVPIASFASFGIGSVIMLYVGLYLLGERDASQLGIVIFVALCSVVWMVTGIMARFPVLHFCGWAVMLLVYGWFLHQNLENFDWVGIQMGWVPAALVLGWLGWLFQHTNKSVGAVLLLVGLLTWFVPEIFGLVWTEIAQNVLQTSLVVKLLLAGILMFVFRKKWTEWVAS